MNQTALEDLEITSKNPTKIEPDLGLKTPDRAEVITGLENILANSYLLMLKTHNYHWNVRGSQFISVHNLTEALYEDLHSAVDVIAERVRSLGKIVEGSFAAFESRSIMTPNNHSFSSQEMIADLLKSNEAMAKLCRSSIEKASEVQDEATADLLTNRLAQHEKASWMLRSSIDA